MILGFLKEKEAKISPVIPGNIGKLKAIFSDILIEPGIGESSFFKDGDYEDVKLLSRDAILAQADVVIKVHPDFSQSEYSAMKEGSIVISQFAPFADPKVSEDLQSQGVNAFSLDMIPRTSLAQSMDILSSMASIAGYQAVLNAVVLLPRYMPMMITAAGSIKPSRVLIIGAGVAGLQAIATAKRLGAMVEAFDTRVAVKEEVQSLGAKFVEVEGATDDKDAGGYAVEQTEEYKKRQGELIQEKAMLSDIVVTTAQLRGKPAPLLITEETVRKMKKGAVVVDLATSTGGNCALSKDNEIVDVDGVRIIGNSSLAYLMPQDASTLYSNNILNYLKHIAKDGTIDLNSDDEILSKSLISKAQ